MQVSGIAAVLLAATGIVLPIFGPYVTIPSAVLAAMAGAGGRNLGVAALVVNTVNLFWLSPSLWFTMDALAETVSDGIGLLLLAGLTFAVQALAAVLLLLGQRSRVAEAAPLAAPLARR